MLQDENKINFLHSLNKELKYLNQAYLTNKGCFCLSFLQTIKNCLYQDLAPNIVELYYLCILIDLIF